MVAADVPIVLTKAMEHMSNVWLELILAVLAAIAYMTFSRKSTKAKRSGKIIASAPEEEKCKIPDRPDHELTPSQLALKAMRQGRMADAIGLIHRSPDCIRRVPTDLACRLLMHTAKASMLSTTADQLKVLTGKISSQALDAAMVEAIKLKDVAACRQLHMISGLLSIPKSQQAFEILAKSYVGDTTALRVLIEEAGTPLATPFAEVALEACVRMRDSSLAAEIFERASGFDAAYLREVVEKATLAVKEGRDSNLDDTSFGERQERINPPDQSAEINSLKETISPSCKDVAMRANDIRSCGKNGDLKGAIKVFERLGHQSTNTLILNSMLDACVECKDMPKAIEYFEQPELHAVADVISHNTMMKGYIACGQEAKAKELLGDLSQKGLSATRTSFHGLLNARVNAKDFTSAWKLMAEMQAAGISPNAVT